MVAADGKRGGACTCDASEKLLDLALGAGQFIGRLNPGITEVGDSGNVEGADAGGLIDAADERGLFAHRARPVPGAGPVGHAAIKGHADDADINAGGIVGQRPAEEGRNTRIARPKLRVGQFGIGLGLLDHRAFLCGDCAADPRTRRVLLQRGVRGGAYCAGAGTRLSETGGCQSGRG